MCLAASSVHNSPLTLHGDMKPFRLGIPSQSWITGYWMKILWVTARNTRHQHQPYKGQTPKCALMPTKIKALRIENTGNISSATKYTGYEYINLICTIQLRTFYVPFLFRKPNIKIYKIKIVFVALYGCKVVSPLREEHRLAPRILTACRR